MTPQSTAAVAGRARTVSPDARHGHDSACYWDVDECRWQCVTYPRVHDGLAHCTAIGRPVADSRPEGRP